MMRYLNGIRGGIDRYYSRGIYRDTDNFLTSLHNKLPTSVFDSMIGSVAAISIAETFGDIDDRIEYAPLILGLYGLIHTVTYSANRGRQLLEVTLGLDAKIKTKESRREFFEWLYEDAKYVGEQLREIDASGQVHDFDFDLVKDAVREQLGRIEGRDPGEFPRPKKFSLVPYVLKAFGAGGAYATLSPEIYLSPEVYDSSSSWYDRINHVVAHELIHSKGYTREKEAELLGHLACMNSGDPTLRRASLINRLFRNFQIRVRDGKPISQRLEEADLPENIRTMLEKDISDGEETSGVAKAGMFLRDNLSKLRQGLAFALTGNRRNDYNLGFLSLLYTYEREYGKV